MVHEVHRRSLLRASAWTLPVVAVAAATPHAAASPVQLPITLISVDYGDSVSQGGIFGVLEASDFPVTESSMTFAFSDPGYVVLDVTVSYEGLSLVYYFQVAFRWIGSGPRPAGSVTVSNPGYISATGSIPPP